jgi:hypothetical protein
MIDASDAEYNAATSVFGSNCTILMCWFHVILKVKKSDRKKLIPSDRWDEVNLLMLTYLRYILGRIFLWFKKHLNDEKKISKTKIFFDLIS